MYALRKLQIGPVWLLLAAARLLTGQDLLDPKTPDGGRIVEAFERIWPERDSNRLDGSFSFVKPALGYNLRHYAGYDLFFPAKQFDLSTQVSLAVVASIECDSGAGRVYLYQRHVMNPPKADPKGPPVAARKVSLHLGGGFYAGPGRYRYRLIASDRLGRVYRREGRFEVKQAREATAIGPNTVLPLNVPAWTGFAPGAKGGHVTVMLNAAPMYPRRVVTTLHPYDRYVLLTALGALLSRGGYSSAHVIVVDLAGRRVLFDEEDFDRGSMRRLRRDLEEADFGTIAYQTLAGGPSPQAVAESALTRAAEKLQARETVVFLGPAWMPSRRKQPVSPALRESLPKVHYLAMVPRNFLPQDTISDVVRALKGRVHTIYGPQDFVNAIKRISEAN